MKVTGKEVAERAFKDLESFYYYSSGFRVVREYNSAMKEHACCSGSGRKMKIRLSSGFCDYAPENISEYFFALFILCHEIAHYLSNHNTYSDNDHMDSVAIEARADHFGASIFLTLLTFGKNTRRTIERNYGKVTQKDSFIAIAESINLLIDRIYTQSTSKKYPDPQHRAMITISGCLSFFNRYFRKLPEDFSISFLSTIVKITSSIHPKGDGSEELDAHFISNKITEVHREIHYKNGFNFLHIKPKYGYFLTSDFSGTDADHQDYRDQLKTMIRGWGVSPD